MDVNVKKLLQRWLIDEPALYRVLCTHEICENKRIKCDVRCGEGKIEYNPERILNKSYNKVNELFRAEAIRILLRHPYDRQPDCCNKKSSLVGSNLVLGDNYSFDEIIMPNPSEYGFDSGLSFEQYSFRIQDLYYDLEDFSHSRTSDTEDSDEIIVDVDRLESSDSTFTIDREGKANNPESDTQTSNSIDITENVGIDQNDDSVASSKEASKIQSRRGSLPKDNNQSDLWQENPLMQCAIDNVIEEIKNSGWGGGCISSNHVEENLASTKAKIDYRKVLAGFRSSILSSKRHLTRMRPNRRSGFDNMGSIRRYDTKLLVGVDVSGSVASDSLRHFFSIISRLFKYGIEKVDVIQFDCDIKEISSFEKAEKTIRIVGRGGTCFQPVVDYAAMNQYDGLIIFTDGEAPEPEVKKLRGCRIAWVCDSESNFNKSSKWMKKQGRCCYVEV